MESNWGSRVALRGPPSLVIQRGVAEPLDSEPWMMRRACSRYRCAEDNSKRWCGSNSEALRCRPKCDAAESISRQASVVLIAAGNARRRWPPTSPTRLLRDPALRTGRRPVSNMMIAQLTPQDGTRP